MRSYFNTFSIIRDMHDVLPYDFFFKVQWSCGHDPPKVLLEALLFFQIDVSASID